MCTVKIRALIIALWTNLELRPCIGKVWMKILIWVLFFILSQFLSYNLHLKQGEINN